MEPEYMNDDLLWEIRQEIVEIISDFIYKVTNQYKFNSDSIDVEFI
jgi:hypothetical protein